MRVNGREGVGVLSVCSSLSVTALGLVFSFLNRTYRVSSTLSARSLRPYPSFPSWLGLRHADLSRSFEVEPRPLVRNNIYLFFNVCLDSPFTFTYIFTFF